MKVDYRVKRKDGTGGVGQAIEERGLGQGARVIVYWGVVESQRIVKEHLFCELEKVPTNGR